MRFNAFIMRYKHELPIYIISGGCTCEESRSLFLLLLNKIAFATIPFFLQGGWSSRRNRYTHRLARPVHRETSVYPLHALLVMLGVNGQIDTVRGMPVGRLQALREEHQTFRPFPKKSALSTLFPDSDNLLHKSRDFSTVCPIPTWVQDQERVWKVIAGSKNIKPCLHCHLRPTWHRYCPFHTITSSPW